LYWNIIRPIVTYACETWVLKETIKNKLMVFERKVLRKICGPTKERDGTLRIKTNDELDKLIRHKNVINHIKAQRLSWLGHLHRMPEERMVKKSVQVESNDNMTTRETKEQMGRSHKLHEETENKELDWLHPGLQ
jgi:ATP-dependent helicase/DNAse subunit B